MPKQIAPPEIRMKLSETYRAKALACENLGRAAADTDIQSEWAEIAIEWHALANRVAADEVDRDLKIV